MRQGISGFFHIERRFKKEFKREIRLLVIVTLAFTIAFSWRQTIFDISKDFIQFMTHFQNLAALSVLTSTFITLTSILLIIFVSFAIRDNSDNY